jgi:hypothetical protein
MKFIYDKKHIGIGYHCCRSCKYVFISGLKPSHKENCADKNEGWNVADYIYGSSELKQFQKNNSVNVDTRVIEEILKS